MQSSPAASSIVIKLCARKVLIESAVKVRGTKEKNCTNESWSNISTSAVFKLTQCVSVFACAPPPELSSHEIYACSHNTTREAVGEVVTWRGQYPPVADANASRYFQLNQRSFILTVHLMAFPAVRGSPSI